LIQISLLPSKERHSIIVTNEIVIANKVSRLQSSRRSCCKLFYENKRWNMLEFPRYSCSSLLYPLQHLTRRLL